jgi:hypothetical protein
MQPYLTACLTRISVLVLLSSVWVFHEQHVDLSPREALISNFNSREELSPTSPLISETLALKNLGRHAKIRE